MRIAPISYIPIRNNKIKSVSSTPSFARISNPYIDECVKKEKDAQKYFEEAIQPQSKVYSQKIDYEVRSALDLYNHGKKYGLKSYQKKDGTTIQYDSKMKGLRKATTIRIFKGNALKKEIEIIPNKQIRIKEFQDSINTYNTYEYDYLTEEKKYCENVREKDVCEYSSFKASSIYTYEKNSLKKYEEGYSCQNYRKNDKQINVGKCFDLTKNKGQVRYFENMHITYGSKDSRFIGYEAIIEKSSIA